MARRIVERAYGKPVTRSVRGVRRDAARRRVDRAGARGASCTDGKEVIVKVLRPGMREVIERDLEVLYALAGPGAALLERRHAACGRSRSCAEYEKTDPR